MNFIMENKEEFFNALEGLEKYSNSICKLVDTFLKIESDGQVTGSVAYLMKVTKLTRPTIYSSLKILKKDHIIIRNDDYRNTYEFNPIKIKEIVSQYKQHQKLI